MRGATIRHIQQNSRNRSCPSVTYIIDRPFIYIYTYHIQLRIASRMSGSAVYRSLIGANGRHAGGAIASSSRHAS
jgi:hypothetical protein